MKFPISNFSRNAWEQVGSHFLAFKQLPCISLKNFISLVGVTATIFIALKSRRSSENRTTHRVRVVHNNTVVPKDKKNIVNLDNAVIVGKTINTTSWYNSSGTPNKPKKTTEKRLCDEEV